MHRALTHPATRLWLVAVLAVGAASHAATIALVRPFFQVSDEMSYFGAAQHAAARQRASGLEAPSRIMPEGLPFYKWPTGKPLFANTAGAIFATMAARAEPADAALLTRLAISLLHVSVVAATWWLARLLYPRHLEVAFASALFAVWQPVLATVNAGVTPDAFANAASGWTVVLVARGLGTVRSWPWLAAATGLAIVAFSFKDTAFCTLVSVLAAWGLSLRTSALARTPLVRAGAVLAALTALAVAATRSPYAAGMLDQPGIFPNDLALVPRLAWLALASFPDAFESFWAAFGNFGAHDIPVSAAWIAAIWSLCIAAVVGSLTRDVGPQPAPAAAIVWRAIVPGIAVALLLHPFRQTAMGSLDAVQGRWVFPMAAPLMLALAVGLRRACGSARGLAAVSSVAAPAIGWLPLVLVVIPFFYTAFPADYDGAHLFLQGVYGRGADTARAMVFVGPVSGWLVQARVAGLAAVCAAAVLTVVVGLRWPAEPRRS